MANHTIFLVKDELASAESGQSMLTRYTFDGRLATALHAASAAVAAAAPRIMRIVAAVEVEPARNLDIDFMCWKAAQFAGAGLDLDQLVWVTAEGKVRPLRTGLPLTARPAA